MYRVCVSSGHLPARRPTQILAGDHPKDWRAPSQETEGGRYVFNLGSGALEFVLVRLWLLCSMVWVTGSPFHRRATRFFLSRIIAVSFASRATVFSHLSHWTVRLIASPILIRCEVDVFLAVIMPLTLCRELGLSSRPSLLVLKCTRLS